jgi:elongation factor G
MKQAKQEHVRNIGIIAHVDAGKTTVTERFLYYTGKTHRLGDVDEGNTTTDWMDQEQERGITITAAVADCPWSYKGIDYDIHLIDTPGHVDFTIEVERSLRVLDGAVVVMDAVEGVEPQTETVWRQADRYGVPRIVFMNKMDRMGADFQKAYGTIGSVLGARAIPIQLPWGSENEFVGCFDVIRECAIHWSGEELGAKFNEEPIPSSYQDEVRAAREALIEALSDHDDALAERFLAEEEISAEEIQQALRKQTIAGLIVPVLCGTALRNKGIQPLLNAVIDYLPSPLDIPPVEGIHPETGEKEQRISRVKEPTCALVFKVMMDEGRRLCYFRVYSGSVKVGDKIWNATRKEYDTVARLFVMLGGKKIRVDDIKAGFLGAARGLKSSATGDTLCDKEHPILLEKIGTQDPVIKIALETESNKDRDILLESLKKLSDEDPTFRYEEDRDTGQILIAGMGELHLDVLTTRLHREFKLEGLRVGSPQVVSRETVTKEVTAEEVFQREMEDIKLFAGVKLQISPMPRGEGNTYEDALPATPEIPMAWREAIREGVQDNFQSGGVLGGYPLVDIRVRLLAIQASDVPAQSTPSAWKAAVAQTMQKALHNAGSIMLEPLMMVEVTVQNDTTGEVIGNLNARHAAIQAIDPRGEKTLIRSVVPLQEMFGYSTHLRSMTQGRGTFTMKFHAFGNPQN